MAPIHRREFLRYLGYAAGASALGPLATGEAQAGTWTDAQGFADWTPVAYPVPIPGDRGNAETDRYRLGKFTVRDDITLPGGFRYEVLAQWREQFGDIQFGFACDYTGLVPVPDTRDEYLLLVNHEYISARPWMQGLAEDGISNELRFPKSGAFEVRGKMQPEDRLIPGKADPEALEEVRAIARRAMNDLGISILHVRRKEDGGFEVIRDSKRHRRCSGFSCSNWSQGDAPVLDGPARRFVDPDSPPRTYSNCSGCTTPWGTFLTCEENFQDQVAEFILPDGRPLRKEPMDFKVRDPDARTGLPKEMGGLAATADPNSDGRYFGWVVEIDPFAGRLCKRSALGRFRHENVSLRCEAGKPLAGYMGDDRRGGHVWKFVSSQSVTDAQDKGNSRLLEEGTLFAARFQPDYFGTWIPLRPDTPLARPETDQTVGGFLWLPRGEEGGHVAVGSGSKAELSVEEWMASIEGWTGKSYGDATLGDLVRAEDDETRQGILLMDAYAMANAAGATPTSRPEDVEVHPLDHSIYVAFTDSTGSGDGSPDKRIFPDSAKENSRQYGAIYRLEEVAIDPAATNFTWGRFVSSGEAAEGGGGFAGADNLAFDPSGNLWVVSDISTSSQNFPVNREGITAPGEKKFMGVFGNNAVFWIPTSGPRAGMPHCFAIGPMECELTGPTFSEDGKALLLSVQHPGEIHGARGLLGDAEETRTLKISGRNGSIIEQERMVPLGSNWPSGEVGKAPRPSVICITREL